HLLMAAGVLLPSLWPSLASITLAALLVGGTFMVITMLAMQEARARAEGQATVVLGRMTAGFALGQLMGPIAAAAIGRFTADFAAALNIALGLSAAGSLLSAFFLWCEARRHRPIEDH
ncbi:MAG: YbfB/YjiJ family MFS transporter, partial [Giesbergeria sp.]|nr:YbfB/YjiJ family MFS transporter [Giesbergeria sp.]